MTTVTIGTQAPVGNHLPFVLFGGVNVLESRDLVLRTAAEFVPTFWHTRSALIIFGSGCGADLIWFV